jgi:hypothetical protein
MNAWKKALTIVALFACSTLAAGIDGKWVSELTMKNPKTSQDISSVITLELKADGNTLSGKMVGGGRRANEIEITNGRIDGDKFSFTTVMKGPRQERTIHWSGEVKGDELVGTRGMREGKGQSFTARRQ